MKEEILNELFFSNKKKDFSFNSEQKKEYQEMVAQIKKIGPGIVEKYNRDYKLLDSLKRAARRDLLPYSYGQPDVTIDMNVKFAFSMEEEKVDQKRYPHKVIIYIIDQSMLDAINQYVYDINPDNCMDWMEEIVGKVYDEVGKAIVQSLSPKTLKVNYNYDGELDQGLDITFAPKENYNESTNIAAINEICENVSEWIDDIDEDYVMEADIEYISESVGDVFEKINSNIESHKKSIKDKITKFKDKVHKNYDTRSLSNLKAGKFFTDKDIVIDNYVDLRSPADISKDVNDLFDDITMVFEDAWKKITKERENKNSFTDYKSAIKVVDDTKESLEKEYDNLDSKDKMAKIFNLDKKKEKHTLTNKELARFIDYMKNIYKLHNCLDSMYTNSIDVMAEYNDDLKDLAKEYNYTINDIKKSSTMSAEDKDYLRYLTDSAKVLSDIIERTFGALDTFYTWYSNDQDDYVALLESYLKAAGIDMNNTKTAKHLLTNSATEDSGEVIEEGFFDKNKDIVDGLLNEGIISRAIKKQAGKIAKRWEEAEKKEKAKRAAEEAEVKEFIKTHKSDVDNVKSQIKKIAPKVIADANKNKSYLKELNENIDTVDADMYNGKLIRKFVYTLLKEKEDYITISIVDKSIMNAVENVGNLTLGDDPVETFNENMQHIIAFIAEDIEDEVDSDTIDLSIDYYSVEDIPVAGQITFWFEPK